jgi:hypothetical protein
MGDGIATQDLLAQLRRASISTRKENLKMQLFSEIIINDPVLIYCIRMNIKAMRIWA